MRKSASLQCGRGVRRSAGTGGCPRDGLPGMRGHDHTGITVPDMNEALAFFVDVLGCKKAMSFGPIADPEPNGTFMKDALGVDPKTVIKQITLVRCGMGSNIELFSYQSPDQKVVQPKNSDIGGYHIAFYVDDIKAAADYLHAKGVKTMMGPIPDHRRPSRRTGDRLLQCALGPPAGGDLLSEGHGLRRRTRRRFADAERPG